MKNVRLAAIAAITIVAGACASTGSGPAQPNPAPAGELGATSTRWPLKTREHVDLWLHGFAMLQDDTTLVPFFKRGYRDEMVVLKNRANVVTQLDANHDKLRTYLLANPALVNAQFVPLNFTSWEEMSQAVNYFLQAGGDPNRAQSQEIYQIIGALSLYFQTSADRDWLRLFMQSLSDESSRFYHSYWTEQQRERSNVLADVDSLWQNRYLPKFQPFLNNSGQTSGDILLSLPLDGEGRTQSLGKLQNVITVTFPNTPADRLDAIYVVAHEAVGSVVNRAVADNITPSEQRNGAAERYASAAAVRGGLLLLQRVAPELAAGYARYYLASAKRPAGSDPVAALAAVFPLPDAIRTAIGRQFDIVLGGI